MFNDVVGYQAHRHLHVFISVEWSLEVHVFISAPPNLAPGVLTMLFHMILADTMSAVRVVSS